MHRLPNERLLTDADSGPEKCVFWQMQVLVTKLCKYQCFRSKPGVFVCVFFGEGAIYIYIYCLVLMLYMKYSHFVYKDRASPGMCGRAPAIRHLRSKPGNHLWIDPKVSTRTCDLDGPMSHLSLQWGLDPKSLWFPFKPIAAMAKAQPPGIKE